MTVQLALQKAILQAVSTALQPETCFLTSQQREELGIGQLIDGNAHFLALELWRGLEGTLGNLP